MAMRLLGAFLKLIRLPNLFFIVLTQFLFYYCILVPVLRSVGAVAKIDRLQFILLSLASVLIAAAGYIINDYFDVNIDQVNKPKKNVVDIIVSRRWAILWHFVLSGIGILLSLYISWKTGLWYIVLANFGCALLLFGYSISLKQKLLSGNVLISVLTSWVILILCLSEFHLSQTETLDNNWLVAQNKIMRLGFLYAGFAFILTLIREAIKDMEDMEGDARYGSKTMPIVWGVPATKVYVAVWMIVLLALLIAIQVYIIRFHWWWPILYCTILIILPLAYTFLKLFRAITTKQFHYLSSITKTVMLTGILSMGFFYFYL
ncbi:MAG TPA: geranylgeranylglycerol-phosphate geranylgeranyltransferase [Chitinophagaceae bacterium]|jgi:4-hydroxybenzoate polyprenyltransferase|nr:geranylgeranylglycerol-phosphate geranylgeranyltransferase [Chitinophagaceae bacterium]